MREFRYAGAMNVNDAMNFMVGRTILRVHNAIKPVNDSEMVFPYVFEFVGVPFVAVGFDGSGLPSILNFRD